MADLGRGRQDGEHQAGAIHACIQPDLVTGVGHHRPQQEQAGGIGQAGDEHGDGRQGEIATGDQGGTNVEDCEDQAGRGQRLVLADPRRQPGPERRPDQPGHEIEQHEQRGLGVIIALDLAEEEKQQRAGDPWSHAQQQVGEQQLAHGLLAEKAEVGLRPAVRCGPGIDGLGHHEHGQADGDRQGDHDGPAHDAHAGGIVAEAGLHHHGRQDQDQDHADDVEHLPPAIDAAALVVLGCQDRGPAQLAEGADGEAQIEDQQPAEQIGRTRAGLDHHEHHQGRQHQDRRRDRHPWPVATPFRLRPVHAPADEGVEDDVDQPHGHEDGGDHAQLQTDVGGVELRQGHRQGDAKGRQGQAGPREGGKDGVGSARRSGSSGSNRGGVGHDRVRRFGPESAMVTPCRLCAPDASRRPASRLHERALRRTQRWGQFPPCRCVCSCC